MVPRPLVSLDTLADEVGQPDMAVIFGPGVWGTIFEREPSTA